MEVSIVLRDHLDVIWPSVEAYAEMASKYTYGRYEAIDIREALNNQNYQLWIAYNNDDIYGIVITEVVNYPRMKVLVMHFVAGKHGMQWKDPMLSTLRSFAKANECDIIESHGRAGWERIFKGDGYEKRFTFYELPL